MKVELLSITQGGEYQCGARGAICYNSKTDEKSSAKRLKSCLKVGHTSVLRFAHATFGISNLSRKSADQLMRHAFIDKLCESTRYVNKVDVAVVMPSRISKSLLLTEVFNEGVKSAGEIYKRLIDLGAKKEDAAYLLPLGFETGLQLVGNFQAWLDFLTGDSSRLSQRVQEETRLVAIEIYKILNKEAPSVFPETLGEEYGINIGEE